jgi:hypothetical protein
MYPRGLPAPDLERRRIAAMNARLSQTRQTYKRFLAQEDGQITIFTLILFFLMVAFSGMAVDMMRHENARTDLQQTTDRAILAAASMRQVRNPEAVVRDYFTKAGMIDQLQSVNFSRGIDASWASVSARVPVETYFMGLMDIDLLNASSVGRAEEGVGNIEISLVLDISGSMREPDGGGPNSQITKLRRAAKIFFNEILTSESRATTSINVVPYAGHVNVGPFLFDRLGGVRTHANSSCLELTAADYATANPPPINRTQVPHFMNWTIHNPSMDWGWCPMDRSAIIVAENDKARLDTFIDNIRLHDGTGTMSGMKYGLMLLNPAMQPIFADMAAANLISGEFNSRPKPWSSSVGGDVQKYLIVMTDGNITPQHRPRNIGGPDSGADADSLDNETVRNVDSRGRVTHVNDPDIVDGTDYDLWNRTVELQNQPSGNRTSELTNYNQNVASFTAQCNLAKANGVVVFTIAFNSPPDAQAQMRACASSESYYYQVPSNDDGSAINGAFTSISRTIKQLRLTQ